MRNKNFQWRVIAGIVSVLIFFAIPYAHAGGGGGVALGPATEFTQILNNVELVSSVAKQAEMVANQIQQINYQIEQLKSIQRYPSGLWNDAMSAIKKLDLIVRQGQALAYTLENIEEVFEQKFPAYHAPKDFIHEYQDWSKTTLDSIRNTLEAAGFQNAQFETENATLSTIRNLSNSAVGQTQAIQAANMIANETVVQLQKLRQLHMAQMQAQNSYMAYEVERDASGKASLDRFFQTIPYEKSSSGGY